MAQQFPDLHHFLRAAAQAPWVWACRRDGRIDVQALPSDRAPIDAAPSDCTQLLLQALGDAYGAGAAELAGKALAKHPARLGRPLASSWVREAAACAEAASSLFDGQRFFLRMSLSAKMGGVAFLAACRAAGVDPAAVHEARRLAIDELMAPYFVPGVDLSADEATALLTEMLQRPDH